MLKKDQIHLLGSDCHNLTSRSPNLEEAVNIIRETLGREALERIWHYQQQILHAEAAGRS
jgi:protein-tyrosine phosphatase